MKWNYFLRLLSVIACLSFQSAKAEINFWQDVSEDFQARAEIEATSVNVMANQGRRLIADLIEMQVSLASESELIVSIPLPDGTMADYRFSRSTVMPSELAAKYPQIQTFKAIDINNPQNRGSFDITPQGFHGMFQHDGKWIFIDPEIRDNTGMYLSYYGSDAQPLATRPEDTVLGSGILAENQTAAFTYSRRPLTGTTLRTYRLAMSAAAEYTTFHGGRTRALAAMTTLVNRVNEVYERDLSIRFELVDNNDDIIYTNRLTDPFNNSTADARANADNLPLVIGNGNYDIGHVLNTGGGGIAQLRGVCKNRDKGFGMTGTRRPTGDAFYIDYVAHELGHQLGANHTFNGTAGSCSGDNRVFATAWEPGSGSTIMGYAGICGAQDLQPNSDSYFHTGSIQEILSTTEAAGCGTVTTIQNAIPIADAGEDLTIPANVPFQLNGSGSDTDGDRLTYTWEQYDIGTASTLTTMVDNGSRPLFRSREPSESAVRYFPNLTDFANNELKIGETMPTTSRKLNFRLTVRDSKGGVATDEMEVTVVAGGSTFQVTEPVKGTELELGSKAFVRWDVAGTDQPPVACSTVDILISSGAGQAFDGTLVEGTENDGEYEFDVSTQVNGDSIIMVRCTANGFFALSSGGVNVVASNGRGTATEGGGGGSVSHWFLLLFLSMPLIFFRAVSIKKDPIINR